MVMKARSAGLEAVETAGALSLFWLSDAEMDTLVGEADELGIETECLAGNSLKTIGSSCDANECEVREVLAIVQALDPPGVAARDLRQCLLIQAANRQPGNLRLQLLIERHLERIAGGSVRAVAQDLKCTVGEIELELGGLRQFEPKPARRFCRDPIRPKEPDLLVERKGAGWSVRLVSGGLPALTISPDFKELAACERRPCSVFAGHDKMRSGAAAFAKAKVAEAHWLIKSVGEYQATVLRVAEAIMRFQQPFLEGGPTRLRPLVQREVAAELQVAESTVSRSTTNKFVSTPYGLYELKDFFNARVGRDRGDEGSGAGARYAVKCLIESETPASPLLDEEVSAILGGHWSPSQIAARLSLRGGRLDELLSELPRIDIARRTVTKYRGQLDIPSAGTRKVA